MQYVLTQEELDELKNKRDKDNFDHMKGVQTICTNLANHMPIKFWDNDEAKIWGCIKGDADGGNGHGYCDECPARGLCPAQKHYSK